VTARPWTSAALVVVAAGATAYAYFVDRRTVSDADREARRSDIFPSFRVEDVGRVELRSERGDALVIERDPRDASRWVLTAPRRARADEGSVDALLRELELAKRLRDVPDAEAAGLDAPRVRGKLSLGRLQYSFALGADAPRPEGAAYMRVDGEGSFVVDRTLKVQLLRGVDAYRDRTLVTYAPADVARVEVTAPDGHFAIERRGSTFRVGGPDGLRAARAAVEGLFALLADARAEAFVDDATADRSLGDAAAVTTLVVTPRDGARPAMTLRAGGECPSLPTDTVVVRDGPERVAGCVPRGVVGGWAGAGSDLVDRGLFFARADEIEELRLAGTGPGGLRVDIARRAGGWRERAPADRDLAPDEVDSANTLVADLAAARASDARVPAAGERFAARAIASIVRTGAAVTESIELGPVEADGTTLARRADDGAIVRLSREVARRAEPHRVVLHGRGVWRTPFEGAAVVSIDDGCGPTRQRLELRGGRWSLREPAGLPADTTAAVDLADAVARATSDTWIAESDDGTFGFEHGGACAVALGLAPNANGTARAPATLFFGADAAGGVYAKTAGGDGVFVAPLALRGQAARPAIDRARMRIDPAALDRVVVTRGAARIVLEAEEGRLTRATDAGSTVEASDAGNERLENALASFHAQGALHTGAAAPGEGFDRPTLEIQAIARGDAAERRTVITIGAPTRMDGGTDYFARTSGVEATFAVSRQCVDAILDAL
jgi:Domain of unknown function (DUF4340)